MAESTTLNPADITVDGNIRRTVKTDRSFWSSIKQDGVIVPVIVEHRAGAHHLIDGQRRVLAALDGGLTEIPAVIIDPLKDDASRLVRQLVVNDQREAISDADRAHTIQTLFDLGVTADGIARKTKTPRGTVDTALKVTASPLAAAAINEHQLTLDQAAAIAEFDDDPDTATALAEVAVANPGRLQHEVAHAREERVKAQLIAEKRAELEAAGARVVDYPDWDDQSMVRISDLYADASHADQYSSIKPGEHLECPGRAIAITVQRGWTDNAEYETRQHDYCTDWKANGHVKRGGGAKGELTDEEKAARKQARENNKLWATATTVRLEFLVELLSRKETPAGWETIVAQHLAAQGTPSPSYYITRQLLGIKDGHHVPQSEWLAQNPTRAAQLCLAVAIASIEGEYEYAKKGWSSSRTPAYLQQLSAWGYGLSELEETIAASATKKAAA